MKNLFKILRYFPIFFLMNSFCLGATTSPDTDSYKTCLDTSDIHVTLYAERNLLSFFYYNSEVISKLSEEGFFKNDEVTAKSQKIDVLISDLFKSEVLLSVECRTHPSAIIDEYDALVDIVFSDDYKPQADGMTPSHCKTMLIWLGKIISYAATNLSL